MEKSNKTPVAAGGPVVPELEHAKMAVLNSLGSLQSRRSYEHAITEFVGWYCSAARLAFNRTVVLQYRTFLENKHLALAAATINVRLAAVRRLAYEAADGGIISPDVVAGIRRVRGVRQIGQKVGNWLSLEQGNDLLGALSPKELRGKRDAARLRCEIWLTPSDRMRARADHPA